MLFARKLVPPCLLLSNCFWLLGMVAERAYGILVLHVQKLPVLSCDFCAEGVNPSCHPLERNWTNFCDNQRKSNIQDCYHHPTIQGITRDTQAFDRDSINRGLLFLWRVALATSGDAETTSHEEDGSACLRSSIEPGWQPFGTVTLGTFRNGILTTRWAPT